MSTGTTCTLYLAGTRFADGAPGDLESDPIALSGLEVAWGRDTTVDQPGPSTCSFKVTDTPGGRRLLDQFHTGNAIDVTATGIEYPSPTNSTYLDPGFETDPIAATTQNATVTASTRRVHSGSRALQIVPVDHTRRWAVVLPPAPYVPAGTNPGAWDAIPQTAVGQTWDLGIWVYFTPWATLTVRPVLFDGPWAGHHRPAGSPGVYPPANFGWYRVTAPFQPDTDGSWVGLEISAYPTGPAWADMDPALTWAGVDPTLTWDDIAAVYVDDIAVLSPEAGTPREVLVFSGRITNLAATWDGDRPALQVTAADFTADLANRDVGDEPFLVEPMGDRFNRIITLSGMDVTADIDSSIYGIPISWRDVDHQPATGLLQNLATSVDGVMWPAVHRTTGAYLRVEDPSGRVALYRLELLDDGLVHVVGGAGGMVLSACDVLQDPIEFAQDVSDIATRASVSWLEQTIDEQGKPGTVEHTVTVIDAAGEIQYGTRRISVTTELQAPGDAQDVANRLMARLNTGGWRASGFTVDDDDLDHATELLTVLDGTSRIGLPLRVTELPAWSPAAQLNLYLEGGRFEFVDGRWICDLNVSSARGQGQSATWNDLDPAWTWADLDPQLTWADLYGVAGPDPEVPAP